MVRYAASREDVRDEDRTKALIKTVTLNPIDPTVQERQYTASEILMDSGGSAAAVDRQMLVRGHAPVQLWNLLRRRGASTLD